MLGYFRNAIFYLIVHSIRIQAMYALLPPFISSLQSTEDPQGHVNLKFEVTEFVEHRRLISSCTLNFNTTTDFLCYAETKDSQPTFKAFADHRFSAVNHFLLHVSRLR